MRKINNNYLGDFYIEELENREEKDRVKLYDGTEKGRGMTVITVDAEKSIEEIAEFIWNCVKNLPIHKA